MFAFQYRSREEPTLISALSGKQIVQITCGSTYTSARTANGELYSWGRGNYGRLGHGSSEDHCVPGLIKALKGHRIIDVACGSGDAHTIAVSDTGKSCLLFTTIAILDGNYMMHGHD